MTVEAPAMRKPRVRLREFLLFVTLASLITASFAIRARTARHLSAQRHAADAYQSRVSVAWWEDRLKGGKQYTEATLRNLEDRAASCDLRLMPSVKSLDEIPAEGKDLIIVADVPGLLVFRMFDGDGKISLDWAVGLQTDYQYLMGQLVGSWPPHEMSAVEKARVIDAVTSYIAAVLRTQVKGMQDMHAKAVAEAERHERLARSAGP
jgi:hypothetical protein